ncbi:hypothetical protein DRB96_22625 [Streptomyces sp. ICC1]|nr:hypothetical protein DRB89_34440 [Streptomyces sp. ICC4]AWZ14590.1 hypothetical protein DRB96_22625 [Streptomyces sp. ICC1]
MDLGDSCWPSLAFAGLDGGLVIRAVRSSLGLVFITGWGRAASEDCPDCGRCGERVHDRYHRRVQDLPMGGQPVVITLLVRRFICDNARCERRTFAERFTQLTTPYARCTRRLGTWLEVIGLALAGRAGSRLANSFGIAAGRMTFLRRVLALPDPEAEVPRVLGVDDFHPAWGHVRHCDHQWRDAPGHRRAAGPRGRSSGRLAGRASGCGSDLPGPGRGLRGRLTARRPGCGPCYRPLPSLAGTRPGGGEDRRSTPLLPPGTGPGAVDAGGRHGADGWAGSHRAASRTQTGRPRPGPRTDGSGARSPGDRPAPRLGPENGDAIRARRPLAGDVRRHASASEQT